ncbi:MAG TPA: hypothetical protein VIM51_12270 [Desulfosporosinus sp.]
MPIGKYKLFNGQNMQQFMPGLGQSPFPMRGLERFMQKRGMNFPGMPPQEGMHQFLRTQEGLENVPSPLNVQELPQKVGGIKGFLSQFSRKSK